MEQNLLQTNIAYLKGVGPKKAEILQKELGVFTYQDMLNQFPFRYIDRSQIQKVAYINDESVYYQLVGTISNIKMIGAPRATRATGVFTAPRATRATGVFTDDSGSIELVWFRGLKWLKNRFKPGVKYVLFGKASEFNHNYNFVHPEIEEYDPKDPLIGEGLQGVYNTTERMKDNGLGTRTIAKLQKLILQQVYEYIPETLPKTLIEQEQLIPRKYAYYQIHLPANNIEIQQATRRLKYEEHFFFQLKLLRNKMHREQAVKGHVFSVVGDYFNGFYKDHLPFPLTNAQKRVIKEIRKDLGSGHQMNRLLQGDVGSGKTLVALLCMLIAIDNGCQACLMAPTEILANQHYANIKQMLEGLGVSVELLTGSVKTAAKKKIKQRLQAGEIDILVGTHAVIENDVVFHNLGFVVIDEQHRFGVEQRSKLWTKSAQPPHVLVMTATPIPRTLAMTLYGDLDCSIIDELPPGRKAIKTIHCTDSQRLKVFSFIRSEIAKGRQVYIVYPLIEESETMDLKDLMDGYESIVREFPLPQYQISIVHGRMDSEAKDYEMGRFKRGETQIMVSTTVIEVGVDVPNASVMIIENAERFGLSQLHQLRGRVGRGAEQSYCILMTGDKLSNSGRERINIMVQSTDGFRIAEADLKLRGPGDLQGLQQSGILQLKLADIVNDEPIVRAARESVQEILDRDPRLEELDNACLKLYIQKNKRALAWGKIS